MEPNRGFEKGDSSNKMFQYVPPFALNQTSYVDFRFMFSDTLHSWIEHLWAFPTRILSTRSPSSSFLPFFGEGSTTKIDHRKSWYPYSNLSNLEDLVNPSRANVFLPRNPLDSIEWLSPPEPRRSPSPRLAAASPASPSPGNESRSSTFERLE